MQKPPPPEIGNSDIYIGEDGVPRSARFDDIYYSTNGGLEESRYVFLKSNNLPDMWQNRDNFTIGETGFGTGLNFLAAWDLWSKTASKTARLHFISTEAFPLNAKEMAEIPDIWAEISEKRKVLSRAWPEPHQGWRQIEFDGGRVVLSLAFGDAALAFSGMNRVENGGVDAWFLDGFSPSKNPDLWSEKLFREMARLSAPMARFATFSAAVKVQNGLKSAGFEVEKIKGFGKKRNMLKGYFSKEPIEQNLGFYAIPKPYKKENKIAIIGAGIAGLSLAKSLLKRGLKADIYEAGAKAGAGASGNFAGLAMPRLTMSHDATALFYKYAFPYVARCYGKDLTSCGTLFLAKDEKEEKRLQKLFAFKAVPEAHLEYLTAKEANQKAGLEITKFAALFYPKSGWIRPRELCTDLAEDFNINYNCPIIDLKFVDNKWNLIAENNEAFKADIVILANSMGANKFSQTSWLPLFPRRGQVSYAKVTDKTRGLKTAISGGHYLLPDSAISLEDTHIFGATFDHTKSNSNITRAEDRVSDDERNLEEIRRQLPNLDLELNGRIGRAAIRCTTIDHMPFVGVAPIYEDFAADYRGYAKGTRGPILPKLSCHNGLYLMTGFGSRGFSTAPFAAEILTAQILGESQAMDSKIIEALMPSRSLLNSLKRSINEP